MFSSPSNHPIIPRGNTVIIEKKHVSIHTEDRNTRLKEDGTTVESQSEFSIQLPESLENIAYVKLKNIQLPTYYINIAEKYRNNKLKLEFNSEIKEIIIPDGAYTSSSLLRQLYLLTVFNYGVGTNKTSIIDHNSFHSGRFIFSNNNPLIITPIKIIFNINTYEEVNDCRYKNSDLKHDINNLRRWGLGYILGFDDKSDLTLNYNATGLIESTSINTIITAPTLFSAPNDIRLDYLNTMYLEINDFNTISEIKPDIGHRNDVFNSGYHGVGNAAIAKLHIDPPNGDIQSYNCLTARIQSEFLETKKQFLNSFKTSVHKLYVKFRDHSGGLIDFNNQDFTFTLEFGILRDVPDRVYNILNFA